jgi:hypothetical protein
MKKLRLLIRLLGLAAILFGLSSCKKDSGNGDCVTCTYDGDKDTICKSDSDWQDYAESWDDFVTYMKAVDAISDEMSCDF